jgi:AcrR family transcriptional regulator
MASLSPGLRERKKTQTRTAIETATVDLALEHGLAHVTVDAIAERADVTARTFFNHFADKDDAVLGLARDSDLSVLPVPPSAGSPDAGLTAFQLGAAIVREQLVAMDSDSFALDGRRREVLAQNPQLLARVFEKVSALEDRLTDAIETAIVSAGIAAPEDSRPQALAITMTLGAAVRLASALWSATPDEHHFANSFDNAVATITSITATTKDIT